MQRHDLILLAPIRSQLSKSSETYGSPRLLTEFNEDGLVVGHHRVTRIMCENELNARQTTSSLGYKSPAAFETTFHANEKQETTALQ